MALFHEEYNSLSELFVHQLKDLYDAEHRLTDALPKMADAAKSPDLKQAFRAHLKETENHIQRLESVFQKVGKKPERVTCDAMKGLLSEGSGAINAKGDDDVRDAALIAAAQRVEHYEMAGYGTLRTFAKRLGHADVAQTLQTTLDEEGAADKKLTQIAEQVVNAKAAK